jgi:hypothetical protein
MHAEERTRLRELSAQLAFLLLAALSTIAMIVRMPNMHDGGTMKGTAAVAILLAGISVLQISSILHAVRMRTIAGRPVPTTTPAEAVLETVAEKPAHDELPDHVSTHMSAQTDEDAYTPSSQFREMVEHDTRKIHVAHAPKGPTMIYAP